MTYVAPVEVYEVYKKKFMKDAAVLQLDEPAYPDDDVIDYISYHAPNFDPQTSESATEKPESMLTAFGSNTLAMLDSGFNPRNSLGNRHNSACVDAELRFTAVQHYPVSTSPKHSPVIILQAEKPVGVVKPWGEKTVLGVAEANPEGIAIFPGSIAEPTQEQVNKLLKTLARSPKPTCVNYEDLESAVMESLGYLPDDLFQTIRMSGLVDPISRELFGEYHKKRMTSIEELREKTHAMLAGNVKRMSVKSLQRRIESIEAVRIASLPPTEG